jgi:Kef-type K+ transport system membrane component KefB
MLGVMQMGGLEPFTELAVVIGLAAALGVIGSLLRQPLLMAFIGAGILAGPDVLGLLSMDHEVRLLASIGICVLLFVVGLRLDLNIICAMGPTAAVLGAGQVVVTALVGFGLCQALRMPWVEAAYVAGALTFSSTIIVVKLLSDKREIDSLHGRMALGLLIVQDIVVVVVMIALSTAEHAGDTLAAASLGSRLATTAMRGLALLLVTFPPETVPSRILVSGAFQEVRPCQASVSRRRRSSTSCVRRTSSSPGAARWRRCANCLGSRTRRTFGGERSTAA